VDAVREHLDVEGLKNVHRPGQVLRTCWQAKEAAQDPAASSVLLAARTYLKARAAAIGDERLAHGYLTAPVNAGLLPTGEEAG
jgi:hypothetical protein